MEEEFDSQGPTNPASTSAGWARSFAQHGARPSRLTRVPDCRASNKLFLGGLSWVTTEETIRHHFQKYGEVTEVIVMRDRVTNKPRGFGFITFRDQSSAEQAFVDAHTLDGRTIDAKPSLPHGEHSSPRSKKIFVGGLAPETTEDAFKHHFEKFGKVIEAQIMVDHTSGRSRGFGFITFEDDSAVAAVFSAGSMQELDGKKVEVKTATPKGSGPIGRGPSGFAAAAAAVAAGRGIGLGATRSFMPSRFGEFIYSMGPAGYPALPAGYMPVPGYLPYGAFHGMMLGSYSSYPYGGTPYGFPGFVGSNTLHQQQRTPAFSAHDRRPQQARVVTHQQRQQGRRQQPPPQQQQQQGQPHQQCAAGDQETRRSEAAATVQQLAQIQRPHQCGLPSSSNLVVETSSRAGSS